MFCPRCGTEHNNGVSYCASCGAAIASNQPIQSAAGSPPHKTGNPQFMTRIKALPKHVKLLILAVALLAAGAVSFYAIGTAITTPENTVRGYFEARISGNWGKMYEYLSLEESGFINIGSFVTFMDGVGAIDVARFQISDITTDDGMPMTYSIDYLLRGRSEIQTEIVRLVKTDSKKLLFFDDFDVIADLTISDYRVHAPSGADVYVNDIKLTQASSGSQDGLYNTHIIPEIFPGMHLLRAEHSQYEDYVEQVSMRQSGSREHHVRNMTLKESVRSELEQKTMNIYRQILSHALAGEDFDGLGLTLASGSESLDSLKTAYANLAWTVGKDDDGTGCGSIAVTGFDYIPHGGPHDFGRYAIELAIEFDYTFLDMDALGDLIETSGSNRSSISVSYLFENGEWVLSALGNLGIEYRHIVPQTEYVITEVIPLAYDYVSHIGEGLIIVRIGDDAIGKWGIIDETGREIVPIIYDSIGSYGYISEWHNAGYSNLNKDFNEASRGGEVVGNELSGSKWGVIDMAGREIVPFEYDFIYTLDELGIATVVVQETDGVTEGLIELATGRVIVPTGVYGGFNGIWEGLAVVCDRPPSTSRWGVVDLDSGELIVPLIYTWVRGISESYTLARKGEQSDYGFIDMHGREITPFIFDQNSGPFKYGVAPVGYNNKWGIIDTEGNYLLQPEYSRVTVISPELAEVVIGGWESQVSKVIEFHTGRVVADSTQAFRMSTPLRDGMAIGTVGDWGKDNYGVGVFDTTTYEAIVEPIYGEMRTMSYDDDLIAVTSGGSWVDSPLGGGGKIRTGEKWGIIDMSGQVIAPAIYDGVQSVSAGLFAVAIGERSLNHWESHKAKWGIIDKAGNTIVPIVYDDVRRFSPGLFAVAIGEKAEIYWDNHIAKWGIMDKSGNTVMPIEYDYLGLLLGDIAFVNIGGEWTPADDFRSGDFIRGSWGIANRYGSVVFPDGLRYNKVRLVSNGIAAVEQDGKWGFISIERR